MRFGVLTVAAVSVVLFAGWGSASTNLIENGGFETPVLAPGEGRTLAAGDSSMAPWVITAGSVDVIQNGYWPAYKGINSIDLAGVASGTISQPFATTPRAEYALSFAYASNADAVDVLHQAFTASGHVTVTGAATVLDATVSHSGSSRADMGYQLYRGLFAADSSSATLQFQDVSNFDTHGLVLDEVSVSSVLPGDANDDGHVNFDDLLILAQNYGKTDASFAQGDFNNDGTVNFDDLLLLAQNYGQGAPAAIAAVPEPASAFALTMIPLVLLRARR